MMELKVVRPLLAFIALLAIVPLGTASTTQQARVMNITVMSYNIRCSLCDFEYPWSMRVKAFQDIFARNKVELLGAQELTFPWEVKDILDVLPGGPNLWDAVYYESYGGYVDDPDATIFYRKDMFRLIENGFYWLSPTPDEAFSRGCSGRQVVPRLLNWALFLHRSSQQTFYFATTHFDNNMPCQPFSANLLKSRAWTGDFNSAWDTVAFKMLTTPTNYSGFHFSETFSLSPRWQQLTNVSPPPAYDPKQSIDHVFVNATSSLIKARWEVSDWFVDMYQYPYAGQLYPSDHWPVGSVVQLFAN